MKLFTTLLCVASLVVPVVADTVCRILSMSGGGSHGAFEMGVVTRLMEAPEWKPWDVHLGVSAGSLGLVGLLKDDYQENMERVKNIWSGITTRDIIEPLASKNSFSGNQKIMKLVIETHDTLTGEPVNGVFQVGVTDLVSGEFVSLPLDPRNPNFTYVLASTSIPVVFPPSAIEWKEKMLVAVDGGLQKNEYYLTGLQYCPPGSDSFIMDMVFANYEPDVQQQPSPTWWNLWAIASRSIQLVLRDFDDLYFKDVSECSGQERGINLEVRIHSPSLPLQVGGLDFDHGSLLWDLGYHNMTTVVHRC